MLAYPLDEAETLLQGRLKGAQDSLASCEEDLDFLKEQITVCVFFHCDIAPPHSRLIATC